MLFTVIRYRWLTHYTEQIGTIRAPYGLAASGDAIRIWPHIEGSSILVREVKGIVRTMGMVPQVTEALPPLIYPRIRGPPPRVVFCGDKEGRTFPPQSAPAEPATALRGLLLNLTTETRRTWGNWWRR